jgi:PKD repeat protein
MSASITHASTYNINVSANPLWTDTGVKVVKGQVVSIKASGTWNTGNGKCDPDGEDTTHSDLFITSDAPSKHGELIAFIGSQSTDPYQGHWGNNSFFPQPAGAGYWAIGSNATFTVDRDGELWLGINDDAITKNIGDNTGSLAALIKVTTPALPVAAFSASPTSGKVPLTVTFKDISTGSPTSWRWSFGDGAVKTSQNPIHKYSNAGSYTVKLTVTNAAGSNTIIKTNYIKVIGKPVAAFSAKPTFGNSPLTVTFKDTSTGSPTSWRWSFGDGTSKTTQNPIHTYSTVGNYTVKLTVTNALGSNTTTKSKYITVK